MRTIEAIHRSGIGIAPERTIREAAQIMQSSGVGALAVLEGRTPVGIVTDRDLARRALASGVPPDARIDAIMSSPVVQIEADSDLHDAFTMFAAHGIRRLAVVRGEEFVGMLSIDDLFVELARDLVDLTRPMEMAIERSQESAVPSKAKVA